MRTITEIQSEMKNMSIKLDEMFNELEEIKSKKKANTEINFNEINRLAKEFPIEKHILEKEDEYKKKLYLTLLSSVAQLNSENREAKFLLLNRILLGVKCSGSIEEIIKYGMEINEKTIDEFINAIENKHLRHMFIFESLLIANISGEMNKGSREYISNLVAYLGVTREEVGCLMQIAVSVLEQSNKKYKKLVTIIPNSINICDFFYGYLKNFYIGVLINTKSKWYIGNSKFNKAILKELSNRDLKDTEVIFENMEVDLNELSKSITFENCKSIIFRNCIFKSCRQNIDFWHVKNIEFILCKFYYFENKVISAHADETLNARLVVEKCDFVNCGYKRESASGVYGGCIYTQCLKEFIINNSKFSDCFIKIGAYCKMNGIIAYNHKVPIFKVINIEVKNSNYGSNKLFDGYESIHKSSFINCKRINSSEFC